MPRCIFEQQRVHVNGEMTGISPAYPMQQNGHVARSTDNDDRLGEDASVRRATTRSDESVRNLVHELRNCVAPIVNAVYLIGLRGNRDTELSTLVSMIDRQVAAIIHILDGAADANQAASNPAVTMPARTVEGDTVEEPPRSA